MLLGLCRRSIASSPPRPFTFRRLISSTAFYRRLQFERDVKSVLIVKKWNDESVSRACTRIVRHIKMTYPEVELFHEESTEMPEGVSLWGADQDVDLIVTLGGDGTILHASSLFPKGPVPPVLSFSLGTLGFLLPFHINSFKDTLKDVFQGRTRVLERMRLECTVHELDGTTAGWQVMNEVALHRGRSPHLAIIDAFVDGQHLTEAVSDGLTVSTPTGSTAYSLSAGGPIVHPAMEALLLTPICPRSLSFRPLILPGRSALKLRINERSRLPVEVSIDGQATQLIGPGESVHVKVSPYPIPCVNRSYSSAEGNKAGDDWVRDINSLLQFNVSFKNKNLLDP